MAVELVLVLVRDGLMLILLIPRANGWYSDARFEVLGSPFSLLSASISASQNLYTRKGTLVGFNGTPENVKNNPASC